MLQILLEWRKKINIFNVKSVGKINEITIY